MRKFTGWLLILFCSFLLLCFTISLAFVFGLKKNDDHLFGTSAIISTVVGYAIIIPLLILGLRNGIRRVRKRASIEIVDFPGLLEINLNGQIEYKDYRNLVLTLTFKRPMYLVFLGITLLFALSFIFNEEATLKQVGDNYLFYVFLGITILTPVSTLVQINRMYKTNKVFHQHIEYQITNDSIHLKGDSVDSIMRWNHFYRIKETKDFFMLYPGKAVAVLLDKKMFNSSDLEKFRNFIKSLNVIRD